MQSKYRNCNNCTFIFFCFFPQPFTHTLFRTFNAIKKKAGFYKTRKPNSKVSGGNTKRRSLLLNFTFYVFKTFDEKSLIAKLIKNQTGGYLGHMMTLLSWETVSINIHIYANIYQIVDSHEKYLYRFFKKNLQKLESLVTRIRKEFVWNWPRGCREKNKFRQWIWRNLNLLHRGCIVLLK